MSNHLHIMGLLSAVLLAAATAGCTTCVEGEQTEKYRLAESTCTAGKCQAWRTDPCEKTCDAFMSLRALELTSCKGPRFAAPPAGVLGSTTDMEVECTFVQQSCKTEPRIMSGRPQAGHRARGPARGASDIGRFFARAAECEDASVHAFAELATEVADRLSGGAAGPSQIADDQIAHDLAARCQRAAVEEERHRIAMTRLARRHGAAPSRARPAPSRWRRLADVAIDNAAQGAVEELWAAAIVAYGAVHTKDARTRSILAEIAAEEAGHAALALDLHAAFSDRLEEGERAEVIEAKAAAQRGLARVVAAWPDRCAEVDAGLIPSRRAAQRMFEALFGHTGTEEACAA